MLGCLCLWQECGTSGCHHFPSVASLRPVLAPGKEEEEEEEEGFPVLSRIIFSTLKVICVSAISCESLGARLRGFERAGQGDGLGAQDLGAERAQL